MSKATLSDISKALGFDRKDRKSTNSYFGIVKKILSPRVEGGKYRYSVLIDGNSTTTECARLVGADVGDRVLVSVLPNGHAVVTNRLDGDLDALDAIRKANSVVERIGEIDDEIVDLELGIDTAQATADGKNRIFRQGTQPSSSQGPFADGDLWFNTANDNKMSKYNGATNSWVAFSLGDNAIADLSVEKLKAGTIDAETINIININAGNISSGYIDTARIKTNELQIGQSQVDGLTTALGNKVNTGDNISVLTNDGTYVTGKVIKATMATTKNFTYSGAMDILGSLNHFWYPVNSDSIEGWKKGDLILIPVTITDRNNADAYFLCRANKVTNRDSTTKYLYADNIYFELDPNAARHVTTINDTGVRISESTNAGNKIEIDSNSLRLYKSNTEVGSFKTISSADMIYKFGDDTDFELNRSTSYYNLTVKNWIIKSVKFNIHALNRTTNESEMKTLEIPSSSFGTAQATGVNNLKITVSRSSTYATALRFSRTFSGSSTDRYFIYGSSISVVYTITGTGAQLNIGGVGNSTDLIQASGILGTNLFNVNHFGDVTTAGNIYVKNHTTPIGKVHHESWDSEDSFTIGADVAWGVAGGAADEIALPLTTGVWVVFMTFNFNAVSVPTMAGVRIARMDQNNISTVSANGTTLMHDDKSDYALWVHTSTVVVINDDNSFVYPLFYNRSGSKSRSIYGSIRAVRIR